MIGIIIPDGHDITKNCGIPDLRDTIVSQPFPGLYLTSNWSGLQSDLMGVDLIGVMGNKLRNPYKFAKKVTHILGSIGYKPPEPYIRFKSVCDVNIIMDNIVELIKQDEIDHKTDHVKKIIEFMNVLWMILNTH
jgi:hypothetical protein